MKGYIVVTKSGNSFEIAASSLVEAKQTAAFNCRHQGEKVERVYLKRNQHAK